MLGYEVYLTERKKIRRGFETLRIEHVCCLRKGAGLPSITVTVYCVKFIYVCSMCTIMYGYAHLSVSSCGVYKAGTGVIWSFDALQGNSVYSAHPPTLCLMTLRMI